MNKQINVLGSLLFSTSLVFAAACGDDGVNDGNGGSGGSGGRGEGGENVGAGDVGGSGGGEGGTGGTAFEIPPKPGLGDQIDRMGRPAINTALKGAFIIFDGNGQPGPSDDAARGTLQNGYNADAMPAEWVGNNLNIFGANLAVIDAVDTGLNNTTSEQACSNQPACADETSATCYGTLATVLSEDVLWVRTDGTGCSAADPTGGLDGNADDIEGYLAVEFQALGLGNTGCGGRRPIDDVVDVTYGTLAVSNPAAFGDNIDAPADAHPELFPFMGDPL